MPKIAQSRVDGAKLKIDGIQVSQTQATNFTLAINATISADDSIHAVLDPFEGEMYLANTAAPETAFARVAFPSTTSASLTAVNISQFTEIIDLDAFTTFNKYLLVNDTIQVGVRGNTKIRVSGISRKYDVHFEQAVTINGLGNLDGITVPNSTVALTPDADGNNFFGTVVIPNRSPLAFEIVSSTPVTLEAPPPPKLFFSFFFFLSSLGCLTQPANSPNHLTQPHPDTIFCAGK